MSGEPYYKRCCQLAESTPNLFSPAFAIANLDPADIHGLVASNNVCLPSLVNNQFNLRKIGLKLSICPVLGRFSFHTK